MLLRPLCACAALALGTAFAPVPSLHARPGSASAGSAAATHAARAAPLAGIPKLFRWLTDQYPSINQRISVGFADDAKPVDNLYLDMNGIVHMCTHANDDGFVEFKEREMLEKIFTYTDRLYKIARPSGVLYLAIDGVAPRAKMNQQRSRRFRSAKEAETTMAEMVARGDAIPDAERFDSNCITPGTDFMFKLNVAFQKWIEFKMEKDPFWKHNTCKVVFSGADVPGEGEHKVMEYIRDQRELQGEAWSKNMRHCFYGLDADLIMLSLVTHEHDFVLLREKMSVRHGSRGKKPRAPSTYRANDFELLEVSALREMLMLTFRPTAEDEKLPFEYDMERAIDDFVFMCFFVGNDFLPGLPHLDIADGSINLMMTAYKKLLPSMGGYLTDKTTFDRGRVETFLNVVCAEAEIEHFAKRANFDSEPLYATDRYAEQYYRIKLGLDETERGDGDKALKRKVVADYLDGLEWVLNYYHGGCASWEWFYPWLYSPVGSDLYDLASFPCTLEAGAPTTPMMQLLSVLPPASGMLLPKPYRELMVDELSPLKEFYPNDFETDLNGKRNSWEAVVKIPFIALQDMEVVVNTIGDSDLTDRERLRNTLGVQHTYEPPAPGAEPLPPRPSWAKNEKGRSGGSGGGRPGGSRSRPAPPANKRTYKVRADSGS